MKVHLIAGARPNFMKIAPMLREGISRAGVDCRVVHTGQHYDHAMSQAFFEDLGIREPDHYLRGGSGTHAEQTARIMVAYEALCMAERPDLAVVVGDVNSTLACTVAAKKLGIRVAHVEAGLRSRDMTMPEEINRMVTDSISDMLFATEKSGVDNLLAEGKPHDRVHLVGNIMVDNLLYQKEKLDNGNGREFASTKLRGKLDGYWFMTLHRPSNVDARDTLDGIVGAVNQLAETLPVVFAVHPRTRASIGKFGTRLSANVHTLPPLGFTEALFWWRDARCVLTDSGGLQEETTALGVPCVTIRENTERPVTVELGTNVLAGVLTDGILAAVDRSIAKARNGARIPPMWDGQSSRRIWDVICAN
ncbi:MAG: non-hydrolyzing UDP-N-acetylglucosamine 2-epimerase [Desulfatibacillaceae bacterium]